MSVQKFTHIWVDHEGNVRQDGPFAPRNLVVMYDVDIPVTDMKQSLLDYYKEQGIDHPLNK